MTTDTFPKGAVARLDLGGVPVTITGFAKGSGMIAPDMATMLVFLFTDAAVAAGLLQEMVTRASDATFNCITVDGDTSTSDTLLMAATGRAAMAPIATADDPRLAPFEAALTEVMRDLAQQVVRDGEGATKFVEVRVTGAETPADARRVGLSIANSPLVKTAIAGEDPNWGRVVMAVGKSGAAADRDRLTIRFGDILVAEEGWVAPSYREADGAAYMKNAGARHRRRPRPRRRRGDDLDLRPDQALHRDQRGLPFLKDGPVVKLVLVAAVALIDVDGRVLLARRPEGKAMAGLWEFPGGKVEPGETPEAALIRELDEELGIDTWAELPRAAQLREPRLPGLPPADAALRLPQVAGRAAAARARSRSNGWPFATCRTIPCPRPTGRCSRCCATGCDAQLSHKCRFSGDGADHLR